jgi:hypothetical protein
MFDRGPLQRYQVIWKSGFVEEVEAHQVLIPMGMDFLVDTPPKPRRLLMHGEVDGHWRLILDADYDEVTTVRLLGPVAAGTSGEIADEH